MGFPNLASSTRVEEKIVMSEFLQMESIALRFPCKAISLMKSTKQLGRFKISSVALEIPNFASLTRVLEKFVISQYLQIDSIALEFSCKAILLMKSV